MFFANDKNGEKIEAKPNALGICPSCEERLSAKCGELKVWHWSHIGKRDCDDWYEPETEWHLEWKRLFGKENCEIVMPPHRADILGNFDVVIELQYSNISIEEIKKREEFYKNRNENSRMFWIVDAHSFAENLYFTKASKKEFFERENKIEESWNFGSGTYYRNEIMLDWKRKQKRWLPMFGANVPVMLDFSNFEAKAYYTLPWLLREGKTSERFDIVKNSLFWLRNYYSNYSSESNEEFECHLIGGSFISKQRILERYKPKAER